MKYTIVLYFVAAAIIFSSCRPKEEKTGEEVFEEQMDSFSKSMKDIDKTMDLVSLLNRKIEEIEEKVERGELTREQGNQLVEELNKTYRREIAKRSNIHPAKKLPDWAKALGLSEPTGMWQDQDFSSYTSVNNPEENYNSIKMIYRGEYQQALEQAALIAEKAGIPLSKEYADAYQRAEKYPSVLEQIKGIAFVNYDHETKNLKYKISVSVDENGTLTIYAIDDEQRRMAAQE